MKASELLTGNITVLNEHITKYPSNKADFKKLEELLSTTIKGTEGLKSILSIIHDTELVDVLTHELSKNQEFVMNQVVIDWVKNNLPHMINPVEPSESYLSPLSTLSINKDI